MTGPSDVPEDVNDPQVFIDSYEDGTIDAVAWVVDDKNVNTPTKAQEVVERLYPVGDRPEDEPVRYICDGDQAWLKQDAENEEHWNVVDPVQAGVDANGAVLCWVVRVDCLI